MIDIVPDVLSWKHQFADRRHIKNRGNDEGIFAMKMRAESVDIEKHGTYYSK